MQIDQGQSDFSFRLTVSDSNELGEAAQRFNQKIYAVNAFPISEEDKIGENKIELNNKSITLESLKQMDNGKDCFIVRLFNNADKPQRTKLKFKTVEAEIYFKAMEVKTLVFRNNELAESSELLI